MRSLTIALAFVACSSKSETKQEQEPAPKRKWKAAGYRDTTPDERAAARKALAAAKLPGDWNETGSMDGTRSFSNNDVTIDLQVANAADSVAVGDEPAMSLDELTTRAKAGDGRRGWPWFFYRFKTIADKGSAGDDFWIQGKLERNDRCGDVGCDPGAWADSDKGLVVFRIQNQQRFRCAAHGIDFPNNPRYERALAACKTFTSR
jgi:hypothetical protein